MASESRYQENYHFATSHPEAVAREMTRLDDEITRLTAENEVLRAVNDALSEQMKTMINNASTVAALKDENEKLRAALRAARVAVEDWASYASDFYREKWDLQGDLAHIDAALAA